MNKIKIQIPPFYPMPTALIGAKINGKANFMMVGFFTVLNMNPPMVGVVLQENHYTTAAIQENKTFSISIASRDIMERADYCGIVSGKTIDKSNVFEVEYGELGTAPLIKEASITSECKVNSIIKFEEKHLLVIGDVVASYIDPEVVVNNKSDHFKMGALLLTMPDKGYHTIGEKIGQAWNAGKNYGRDLKVPSK